MAQDPLHQKCALAVTVATLGSLATPDGNERLWQLCGCSSRTKAALYAVHIEEAMASARLLVGKSHSTGATNANVRRRSVQCYHVELEAQICAA